MISLQQVTAIPILGLDNLFQQREIDIESSAAALLAFNLDMAVMGFNDAMHDGQSQTGAFAWCLGGKERIKHTIQDFLWNPAAVVCNTEFEIPAGWKVDRALFFFEGADGHICEGNIKNAAMRFHGVDRVGAKVHDDLVHLGGVSFDGAVRCQLIKLDIDG